LTNLSIIVLLQLINLFFYYLFHPILFLCLQTCKLHFYPTLVGMKNSLFSLLALLFMLLGCSKNATSGNTPTTVVPTDTFLFAKGADIGWLSQMEAQGKQFFNAAGQQQECISLLKSKGINAIRLRVWVNPVNGWCNAADVVRQAVKAKSMGCRIMIDFHYSDWWADPGQQNKPAAWVGLSFANLVNAVSNHTKDVLNQLKANGVVPTWVQVGNENNDGMLWEDGRASARMDNFAGLINAGYSAVKSVDANIKVIVHISNGWDNGLFRWIFDGLKNNGANWDIIAMSLYPTSADWQTVNNQCLTNMNDMIARYNKPIMIAEVGMPWDEAAACKLFLQDIIAKTKSLPNNKGLGVFYWEPQCHNNWEGYSKGAFDNSGKPTIAMDAFAD
jgi:arabinogalactan endo-1,4-beta-galactosidase